MKKILLGNTGIEVTQLCFGALPIGPLQKAVAPAEAGEIIAHGLRSGINYVDTAKTYRTYEHLRLAMELSGIRPVISSKSPVSSYADMERDVTEALTALNVDYIDIFFLHAPLAGVSVFTDRAGALRALIDSKRKGLIRAVGISTHNVRVAAAAADNPDIDVVFPIINKAGRGLLEGTPAQMTQSIDKCITAGKGVVLMKVLAGGSLLNDYKNAMDYVMDISKDRASIALGMVSKAEIDMNVAYMNGAPFDAGSVSVKRFMIFGAICKACGNCVSACPNNAIIEHDGHMSIDDSKCLTCGYCVSGCPAFAIRMI